MISFGIPKGRLEEESISYLQKKGFKVQKEGRLLKYEDTQKNITFYFLRAKDVLTYLEKGALDVGIIGLDLYEEFLPEVYIPLRLPIGYCRLSLAYPEGKEEIFQKRILRIATKFPHLTKKYLLQKDYLVEIIPLHGSIEMAPQLGIADAIVDLVSTGRTLKENHLKEKEVLLYSQAICILNPVSYVMKKRAIYNLIDILS